MIAKTYCELLKPNTKIFALLYDLVLILLGTAALTFSAYVRIPLPFTPVPLTGQTFTVLFIGVLYGSKRGALCLLFYLLIGIAGMPVFQGGKAGLEYFLGPTGTGGYLIGFVAAAFVTGYLAEYKFDRSFWKTFTTMCLGNIVIYIFGSSWLLILGFQNVIVLGVLPFIPGDLIKSLIATLYLPTGWKLIQLGKNK
jgi:biotin transport system substrate-specific component